MSERVPVEIEGRQLSLSNLQKVLYPEAGTTKAAIIDYYTRIADVMLPHLRGRPLTMVRYPNGVDGGRFFEKRCPDHRPDWMGTVALDRESGGQAIEHCDVQERADLVWTANLAALELHTTMARLPDTERPTMVVFDLDPGAPADIVTCARVALILRQLFERLALTAFPKTSGSKGLQLYIPVNQPDLTYDDTRAFSLSTGQLVEKVHPDLALTKMTKSERTGKVFIDWSQNHRTKTTVTAYSLRARTRPTVSTPVTWDEVSDAADQGSAEALTFEFGDVLSRVERFGDLFAKTETLEQELPALT